MDTSITYSDGIYDSEVSSYISRLSYHCPRGPSTSGRPNSVLAVFALSHSGNATV